MKKSRMAIIVAAGVVLGAGALLGTTDQECRITSQNARMISGTEMRITGISNCKDGAVEIEVMGDKHIVQIKNGLFGATAMVDGDTVVSFEDMRD